jgi:hypothetical protein
MSVTIHVAKRDGSFSEWTAEALPQARRAVEAAAVELGSAFSRGQVWENHPLGLRVGFDAAEGWSDGYPRQLSGAGSASA